MWGKNNNKICREKNLRNILLAASENVSPKLRQNCRSHSQLIVAQLVHLLLKNICRRAMDFSSKLTVDYWEQIHILFFSRPSYFCFSVYRILPNVIDRIGRDDWLDLENTSAQQFWLSSDSQRCLSSKKCSFPFLNCSCRPGHQTDRYLSQLFSCFQPSFNAAKKRHKFLEVPTKTNK